MGLFVMSGSAAFAANAELLRLGAVGCISLSVGMWACLLLTAGPAKTSDERKYVSLEAAGAWLYRRAPPVVRDGITGYVPSLFKTTAESAASYVKSAVTDGAADLYARRGEGLPMERIPSTTMEFSAFEAMFGSEKPQLFDTSIRRRDLRRIEKYYRS